MPEISLLLGAGFSVNKGYPTAKLLNTKLINVKPNQFCVATEGTLLPLEPGKENPYSYSHYDTYKQFTIALIEHYCTNHLFEYEEFYDYYKALSNGKKDESFERMCDRFRAEHHEDLDNHNFLTQHNHIFNQMVDFFLVDEDGKKFYQPSHACKPSYPGYTGFLYCLEKLGRNNTVHIHSLNHDLFFETFKNSDWLQGDLSDGFEELGSPFYGDFREWFKIRLSYFTNNFKGTFRFYKLHGSTDQFPFHTESGIDSYIKIKYGINHTSLYKEIRDNDGELRYTNDFINYHPDFLTGTTSKILRYREPWYYEKLFKHFETNLANSKALIIVGYGCRDIEINNLIDKYYAKKKLFLVEPYPHEHSIAFCKKHSAKLIEKTPENLSMSDFK